MRRTRWQLFTMLVSVACFCAAAWFLLAYDDWGKGAWFLAMSVMFHTNALADEVRGRVK